MISSKQISKAVVSLTEEKKDASVVLEKLMKFVKKHKLENSLPQILENIKKEFVVRKVNNTLFVETPFNPNEGGDVLSKVSSYVAVPAGVSVVHRVNKSILGGFRAYFRDKKYDGSIENVLKRLGEKLKEN